MKVLLLVLLTVSCAFCVNLIWKGEAKGYHMLAGASYGFLLRWFNEE